MNARINTEREIGADFGLESTPFVPSIVPMIPIAVEPSFRHVESGCQARDTVKRDAVSHDELSPTESNPRSETQMQQCAPRHLRRASERSAEVDNSRVFAHC